MALEGTPTAGYLGRFRLVGGGRAEAFVTSRGATLIVRAGESVVAASPADQDAFAADLEAHRA